MRRCSPAHVQVKAAGGVRTFDRVLAVRALGVSRVGASATKAILEECKARLKGEAPGAAGQADTAPGGY
jgi:deoxyribose-phosphate aldolase